jgi:hypothetical protein
VAATLAINFAAAAGRLGGAVLRAGGRVTVRAAQLGANRLPGMLRATERRAIQASIAAGRGAAAGARGAVRGVRFGVHGAIGSEDPMTRELEIGSERARILFRRLDEIAAEQNRRYLIDRDRVDLSQSAADADPVLVRMLQRLSDRLDEAWYLTDAELRDIAQESGVLS